ncbi:zinc ABC transporter substrate-binding protein [Candidatus Dependentiae bacterium]|nr:zinc ABC transporter substrate-binding protein [Candidatus Dependentiae bacterium]
MKIKYLTAGIIALCIISGYILYLRIKSIKNNNGKPFHVVCTTTILGDAIKAITLDSINIDILIRPGVDPHTYKPIEPDMLKIAKADLIIYHGLHLEARISDLFAHLKHSKQTLAATECIAKNKLICTNQECSMYDPHVWLHPLLWIEVVDNIAKKLGELIPHQKDTYIHNAQIFIRKIQQMYQSTLEKSKKILPEKRVLITSHDAFSYFAQAYNFETMSLQGINTATQTGFADITAVVNFIIKYKIPTIFIESSIPAKTMHAIQERVQNLGMKINIGDELYSDSLSISSGPAATYLDMIDYNLNTIINGLT